jgi:hypothetical protein
MQEQERKLKECQSIPAPVVLMEISSEDEQGPSSFEKDN